MYFDVSIGKIESSKPFISISSNLVILLILMPRFQILHFPGPEMARLLKNCYQCFELTDFFITFIALHRQFWKKKLVKLMLSNFSNFNCWKNPKFYLHFLHNLAISGPGKCKIWNSSIKINKLTKFELWEMMRSKVYFSLC